MPTMYEELMLVARDARAAARAARLAADAASRARRRVAASRPAAAVAAAFAASRAARSAVRPATRAAFEASAIADCMFSEQDRVAMLRTRGVPPPQVDHVPGKSVTKEDLASDEATWALYERYCKAYNKERDHGDMAHRFDIFKSTAESTLRGNELYMYEPERQSILGPYADGLNAEEFAELKSILIRNGDPVHMDVLGEMLVEDLPADQSP